MGPYTSGRSQQGHRMSRTDKLLYRLHHQRPTPLRRTRKDVPICRMFLADEGVLHVLYSCWLMGNVEQLWDRLSFVAESSPEGQVDIEADAPQPGNEDCATCYRDSVTSTVSYQAFTHAMRSILMRTHQSFSCCDGKGKHKTVKKEADLSPIPLTTKVRRRPSLPSNSSTRPN
jgi:hypothetical protein